MDRAEPHIGNGHKALLVDYGGVLTTSMSVAFAEFCEREGLDGQTFRKTLFAALADPSSPTAKIETGELSSQDFDAQLAAMLSDSLGRPIDSERLVARLFSSLSVATSMVNAIERIRNSGVTTVLLSNSWGGAAYKQEVIDRLFDHRIISGEVGIRKPDPAIYKLAAKTAGVDLKECVFIDDLPINCDAAKELEIHAIHHTDPSQTISELHQLFGATPSA